MHSRHNSVGPDGRRVLDPGRVNCAERLGGGHYRFDRDDARREELECLF